MDNFLFALLAGMLGAELANQIADDKKRITAPIFLIYAICFTMIYTFSSIFMGGLFLLKGFEIPWKGIGIFSVLTSTSVSIMLWIIRQLKK